MAIALIGTPPLSRALGTWQKAEIAKWWPMIRDANVKVD